VQTVAGNSGKWSSGNPFAVCLKWSKVALGCKWQKPNDESAAVAGAGPAGSAGTAGPSTIAKVLVDMERAHIKGASYAAGF